MSAKKTRSMTGVLRHFLVYKGPIIVGKGWTVLTERGFDIPTLFNNEGERLPEDWYTLGPDSDKPNDILIVISRGIH